jgi:hypothetical protein
VDCGLLDCHFPIVLYLCIINLFIYLFVDYVTSLVRSLDYVVSNEMIINNNELERM